MKILYVHPKAWSGEVTMLATLVRMGHEVCVFEEIRGERLAMGGARRVRRDWYREPGDRLPTLWYDPGRGTEKILTWIPDRVFRRSFEGRNLVHRMWVLREAMRLFRPEVMVCADGFSYAIPAAFLKALGLLEPLLVAAYIGGDVLDCPEADVGKRRERLTGWLIRKSVAQPDLLRAVSPMIRDILLEEGADPARIRVIPTHLDGDPAAVAAVRLRRTGVRRAVRSRHGIGGDAPLVVTLSANHKGKGLQTLAEAWPAVLARHPQARWLLCGPEDRWLAQAVWPLLERAGARGSVVRVAGYLDRAAVYEHLAAADLHLNPSLCESLNMVTVEAAAVGTPTITSDGAGICDWVRRFEAGAVVPRLAAAPLADATIRALDSAELRARWGENCGKMVAEFLPETVARQLLEAIAAIQR